MLLEANVKTQATKDSVFAELRIGRTTLSTIEFPGQERGIIYLHNEGPIAIAQRDFEELITCIYSLITTYENEGSHILIWGTGTLNCFIDRELRPILRAPKTYHTISGQPFKKELSDYLHA